MNEIIDPRSVDRPNSYIGKSIPRPNAKKLVEGRGQYVDDVILPRMVHVAFVRSPHAHARIVGIDAADALKLPGVLRVFTGKDLSKHCEPWVSVLVHLKGMKSAPQHPLPLERATWVGEAVAAVVAESRAIAEDAVAKVNVTYEPLPAAVDMETALAPDAPVIHPDLGDNLCFQRVNESGKVDDAFAAAHKVVEATFHTGRHTGVTLEPRSILADYNRASAKLTVYHSTQAPHMMQGVFAKHMRLPEGDVRVICTDVGGSYGIKVHVYPDEMATAVIAKMLARPVKFIADRLESFTTDIHARDHRITGRMAVDAEGRITAIDIDDLTGIGPYSVYPRTSAVEGNQVVNLIGGPYDFPNYRAKTTVVFQNKTPTCQYRAVGHPIASAVTEGLVDLAAEAVGLDPVEFRRRNLMQDGTYPRTSPAGMKFEGLSHEASLAKLLDMIDYPALRAEQERLRAKGIHRGIGFASFIELTNPSPFMYGIGGARISAQDGCTVRIDPDGSVVAATGVTEQGQGTEAIIRQIVAEGVGVPIDQVRVITGDTLTTPYGGGTWACRGAGIGGEAALQAGIAVKEATLEDRRRHAAGISRRARSRQRRDHREGHRPVAHAARRALPHRLLPRRHAAARPAARADADAAFHHQGIPVRLHQRRAGLLARGGRRHRHGEAAEALVRGGLRPHHQPAAGGRAGARRHRAGHRRRALRALHLLARGPAPDRLHGRLPGADVGGDARHRGRPRRDADEGIPAGRQRCRRGRHCGRTGGHHERHQRRAEAFRRESVRPAVHAGAHPVRARQGAGAVA